jgi:hypothetical protein
MSNSKHIIIGYWHNISNPDLPDPAWFIDDKWDRRIRRKVIAYLKNGIMTPHHWMGYSWCRFRCGKDILGSAELTDGKYVWPEGLSHYVKHHNVRLPQEIVDHFLQNGTKHFIKKKISLFRQMDDKNFDIDYDWWKQQRGWNTNSKSFRDLLDIGIVSFELVDKDNQDKQKELIFDFLKRAYGITEELKSANRVINGEKLDIKGRFENYQSFAEQADKIGIKTTFKELTYQEYEEKQ